MALPADFTNIPKTILEIPQIFLLPARLPAQRTGSLKKL